MIEFLKDIYFQEYQMLKIVRIINIKDMYMIVSNILSHQKSQFFLAMGKPQLRHNNIPHETSTLSLPQLFFLHK